MEWECKRVSEWEQGRGSRSGGVTTRDVEQQPQQHVREYERMPEVEVGRLVCTEVAAGYRLSGGRLRGQGFVSGCCDTREALQHVECESTWLLM